MKTTIALSLIALTCSCSHRTIRIPYKIGTNAVVAKYSSTRLGNNEALKEVTFRGPNGELFSIMGFSGNQSEGLEKFSEGAARGAVQGMMGAYKLSPKNDASVPQPEIK